MSESASAVIARWPDESREAAELAGAEGEARDGRAREP